jgi:spermidine synthase
MMMRLSAGVSLVALVTLTLELALTRVFDVILTPNMGYMIITCALFAFGLAGIYATLRPPPVGQEMRPYLATLALVFAFGIIALRPLLNLLPFDLDELRQAPLKQGLSFLGMYLVLVIPFFFAGLVLTAVFSEYAKRISALYGWDLAGAAVGCVIVAPLVPAIGPGGLVLGAAGLACFASALFATRALWSWAAAAVGVLLILSPFAYAPRYFDFREHMMKRGVEEARALGSVEFSRWDPISRIDVINPRTRTGSGLVLGRPRNFRFIAYDGGSQSSTFYAFDGDFRGLRDAISRGEDSAVTRNFWQRGVLASHFLKRDRDQRVLVIGSAGGQEVKAALMYGAAHVDGVELVATVVELGKTRYADYIGGIFRDPRVRLITGEGRSFLRASRDVYDIIQVFSNHTSSSIAQGTGALSPNYLQTAEAYGEFFEHLAPGGILHINHHVYPRMVTTAALAWRQMGRADFQQHVLVVERRGGQDNLPTMLVKADPWTEGEVRDIGAFFSRAAVDEPQVRIVENPIRPTESFLSPWFYSGEVPRALSRRMPFRIRPATDDRPYFNLLRRRIGILSPDSTRFLNESTAGLLNGQLGGGVIPMDVAHLAVTGAASLVFTAGFVLVPLLASKLGRRRWPGMARAMAYFACLGAGFIIIELVFIQIFMKLIGFPIYTLATVLFTLLLGAGLGSAASTKFAPGATGRWVWPFAGIIVTGVGLALLHRPVFEVFLASPTGVRILAAGVMIFPIGFFLGMPFPLGIQALTRHPREAIAWAWALNALFTVVGGLASVLLSVFIGFTLTLLVAVALYVTALVLFRAITRTSVGVAVAG